MNRKSQVYFLAGVILVMSIFLLTTTSKIYFNKNKDYSVVDNFYYESINVLNYAILNNENIEDEMIKFCDNFLDYVNDRNLKFNFVLIFSDSKKNYLLNYLEDELLVNNQILNKKDVYEINEEVVKFYFNDQDYEIELNETFPFVKCFCVLDNIIIVK
ncbi:MAG: hypothetical protein QXE31_03965 [Candidatus Woesearchaeota archaeon]